MKSVEKQTFLCCFVFVVLCLDKLLSDTITKNTNQQQLDLRMLKEKSKNHQAI